jgi:hypothetical protein
LCLCLGFKFQGAPYVHLPQPKTNWY